MIFLITHCPDGFFRQEDIKMSLNALKLRVFFLLMIFCFFTIAVFAADRPVYEVYRTSSPINIDGVINEQVWTLAQPVGAFLNSRDGTESSLGTEGKILYDDKFLYFAFTLEDSDIWSTFRNRDDHLWLEEVIEVYLVPDPKNSNYIELEVNPLGAMIDIYLLDIRKPLPYKSWNSSELEWAVSVDGTVDEEPGDKGWQCEIKFPLADAVTAPNIPPKPGDTWGMNLYRIDKKPERAGLAWSPIMKGDYHTPSMFGSLVFSAKNLP